jgi:putative endonuclease
MTSPNTQKNTTQRIGKQAEIEANRYLQSKGLKLLHENYRCFYGEIDLIMQEKDTVVFVEVRCRSRLDYGAPLETVNKCKRMKLIKTATHYLQKKTWLYKVTSRFDIVSIYTNAGKCEITWVKNAFMHDESRN